MNPFYPIKSSENNLLLITPISLSQMTRSNNVTVHPLLEIETAVPWRTVWWTSVNVNRKKLEHIDVFIEFVLSCILSAKQTLQMYWLTESQSLNILC